MTVSGPTRDSTRGPTRRAGHTPGVRAPKDDPLGGLARDFAVPFRLTSSAFLSALALALSGCTDAFNGGRLEYVRSPSWPPT